MRVSGDFFFTALDGVYVNDGFEGGIYGVSWWNRMGSLVRDSWCYSSTGCLLPFTPFFCTVSSPTSGFPISPEGHTHSASGSRDERYGE